MASGSVEPALASGVPSIMSEKATRTNVTATFACLSMTAAPLGKRNAYHRHELGFSESRLEDGDILLNGATADADADADNRATDELLMSGHSLNRT